MVEFVIGALLILAAAAMVAAFMATQKRYQKRLEEWKAKDKNNQDKPDRPNLVDAAWPKVVSGIVGVVGAVFLFLSLVYFQDPGESVVLRSFTGTLSGISSTPGMHFKSPFDTCIRYDVRNNTVTFVGDGTVDQVHGGTIIGPHITFQDKEGVTGNLDIVIRYSLDSEAVSDLYINYLNQENFVTKVVAQDVRSISRQIPGGYGTLQLFNSRAEAEQAVFTALETKWANQPIILEAVNLQEIRYSNEIKQRYDDAQSARVAVDKAQAEQDAAEIQAETARITAQGQADANAILDQSLTDNVLRQHYIDALNNGSTIYVVPDGSTPFIGVP